MHCAVPPVGRVQPHPGGPRRTARRSTCNIAVRGGSWACSSRAHAAPTAAGELADQLGRAPAEALEDARVLVGVHAVGELAVGLLGLAGVALLAEQVQDLAL